MSARENECSHNPNTIAIDRHASISPTLTIATYLDGHNLIGKMSANQINLVLESPLV